MRRVAVTMMLVVGLGAAQMSGPAFAKPARPGSAPGKPARAVAAARELRQEREVAQLRAELAQVKQELAALMSSQQAQLSSPIQNAPVAPSPEPTAGGLTPTRILTPNPQNYWLRLRQPQTGNMWSFASEPSSGMLRLGSDSAPTYAQLRLNASGAMTTGPLSLNATGVASPDFGSQPPSSSLAFHASAWDPDANAPVDVTSALRLGTHNGDTYYGATTEFLDPSGFPWVWFLDFQGDRPGHEYFFESDEPEGHLTLQLKNHAPATMTSINFYAGDVAPGQLGQWIVGVEGGTPNGDGTWEPGDFQVIRDWWWTALRIQDEDGRVQIGRLPPGPYSTLPPDGRLHVRGYVDEPQLVVDANIVGPQSADILQVRDGTGANCLAVTNTGDTAVGASSQPRAIVLYDIADGSAHYLRVNNGQLELVTP
jgi:hypothetical protein